MEKEHKLRGASSLLAEARLCEELGFELSVEWTPLLAAGGLSALVLGG
jgi:hypothetical protein